MLNFKKISTLVLARGVHHNTVTTNMIENIVLVLTVLLVVTGCYLVTENVIYWIVNDTYPTSVYLSFNVSYNINLSYLTVS